eukprot:jgi/Botrbrau1/15311/Bobra.0319s0002.3
MNSCQEAAGMPLQILAFSAPHAIETDSDQDSDDDIQTGFSASRYIEAQIRQGLKSQDDYMRAVDELRCCILQFYGRTQMSKDMRHLIEEDATCGLLVQDRGFESRRARLRLLSAMERRFPKKVVKQIKRLKHQQDVQLSRLTKAGARFELLGSNLDSLPHEVLFQVFCLLDPFSLASCMSVCRAWREICSTDDIWSRMLRVTFPNQNLHNNESCCQRQQFATLAKDDMRPLRWWKSGRRYANGRLTWRDPCPISPSCLERIWAPSVTWVISYIGFRSTTGQSSPASSDHTSASDDDHVAYHPT